MPSYFDGTPKEFFTFLIEQVEKREAALKDRAAELKDREVALRETAKMLGASKKRKAGSIASSGRGLGELSQESFRKRLLERDLNTCVLTGREKFECDACHIVPFDYIQKHDKKVFDLVFPSSCDNGEHRIMDVRNGILMWKVLHSPFDSFYFTIIRSETSSDPTYTVKTQDEDLLKAGGVEAGMINIIIPLDRMVLQFNRDKPNERPGEKFLKFHNECFEAKEFVLKAAADEYDSEQDESNETVAVMAESIKKAQEWLTLDEYDESVLV